MTTPRSTRIHPRPGTGTGARTHTRTPVRGSLAILASALAVLALALPPTQAAAKGSATSDWALSKETTLHQTYPLATAPGGGRSIEIDNYCGTIRVSGRSGGGEVAVTVHQVFRADTATKLDLAQRAVTLQATDAGGRLRLVADGPFRSPNGDIHFHGWRDLGYEACFDFTVEAPANADVVAHNVQGGEVHLTAIGGHFDANNVNGPIVLEQMAGTGRARTVNGTLQANFANVPAAAATFETVNGRVDVTFPPALAADLAFKTINGEVYSDFPYTYLNPPPAAGDAGAGKGGAGRHHTYSLRRAMSVKVAGGGPQLSFTTVNGDILIHRGNA
jgi:hypothetical protein